MPYIVAGGYANTSKLMHKLQRETKGVDPKLPLATVHDGKEIGVSLEKFNDSDPGFLHIIVTPDKLDIKYFLVPFEGVAGDELFDAVPTLTK